MAALRWRISLLLAAAIAISYFDRQTLPVAIKAIQNEIPISNTQFSQLQAAFLTAYALMYAGGGKLIDVLGTRTGFLLIMIGWSLACASHGLAANVIMLAASRLLLGMGEGGGFPAATRAIAEWFSVKERSNSRFSPFGSIFVPGISITLHHTLLPAATCAAQNRIGLTQLLATFTGRMLLGFLRVASIRVNYRSSFKS